MKSSFLGFIYHKSTASSWFIRFENFKQKQLLKPTYSSDKIVAICGFVKIQRPISAIDGSIISFF